MGRDIVTAKGFEGDNIHLAGMCLASLCVCHYGRQQREWKDFNHAVKELAIQLRESQGHRHDCNARQKMTGLRRRAVIKRDGRVKALRVLENS